MINMGCVGEGLCTKEIKGVQDRGLEGSLGALKDKTSLQVGLGNQVNFWKDELFGNLPLRDFFSNLYSRATIKDAWTQDVCNGRRGPMFVR